MAILELSEAKRVLRVDHDDEDTDIQAYIDAAERWIGKVIGKEVNPENADLRQAARMLVSHWYDPTGRAAVADRVTTAVPFGVRALLANHRSFVHGGL